MVQRYKPEFPQRRSIRLRGHDYTQPGAYFVTIVTQGHRYVLGDIVTGKILLNDTGRIVSRAWEWLATQYAYVELDGFVVMPNHLHGIIVIAEHRAGDSRIAPTKRKPLGRLIGAFKTVSTKRVNLAQNTPKQPLWQRNYYEHIIRNEADLDRAREYIMNNPLRWETDGENPRAHHKHQTS